MSIQPLLEKPRLAEDTQLCHITCGTTIIALCGTDVSAMQRCQSHSTCHQCLVCDDLEKLHMECDCV